MRIAGTIAGLLVLIAANAFAADVPITAQERAIAAQLTRLRGVRLWWDSANRVTGVALKGVNANDAVLRSVAQLPKLRCLVLVAVADNCLTDRGIAELRKSPHLELLFISGSDVTDQGLAQLRSLHHLRALVLKGRFTDSALDTVGALANLEFVDLTQSHITDSGLQQLGSLPKLQTLILNGTQVTNEGMAAIGKIKTLRWLYLGGTQVGDDAVTHLKQLTELDELMLNDTRLTTDGLQKLRAAMDSGCEIYFDGVTYRGTREPPPGLTMATRRVHSMSER